MEICDVPVIGVVSGVYVPYDISLHGAEELYTKDSTRRSLRLRSDSRKLGGFFFFPQTRHKILIQLLHAYHNHLPINEK